MALKDYMAISGQSGLFKFVSQGRNGIIVESLVDGRRTHVSASAKVSALSDIAIFTNEGEVPLGEVLEKIRVKQNSKPSIPHKSTNDELKKYFLEVLPEYDTERVYVSDIKKVIAWYNQLQELGIMEFIEEEELEEEKPQDETQEENAEKESETKAKTEKKKPASKKTTKAKADTQKTNTPKRTVAKPKAPSAPKTRGTSSKKV